MKRRPRDIGTAAETAVVRYLHTAGFPHAERRSLRGNLDAGDITGTPGICWEVKGGDAARTASDLDITRWMAELAAEVRNARATVGLLVVQRAGVGPANAGRWWAWMPSFQFADLATPEPLPVDSAHAFPVRMLLADAVSLLRAAGYGSQPTLRADTNVCQVANPAALLPCDARESGGYRCEVQGPHDRHRVGEHTTRHALAGDGYACSAISTTAPPAAVPFGDDRSLPVPVATVPLPGVA